MTKQTYDNVNLMDSPVKPPMKRTGGKQRELDIILPYVPKMPIKRYIEPFFGSGAVWLAMSKTVESHVNDKSDKLMLVWHMLQSKNEEFYAMINRFDTAWEQLRALSESSYDDFMAFVNGTQGKREGPNTPNDPVPLNPEQRLIRFIFPYYHNLKLENFGAMTFADCIMDSITLKANKVKNYLEKETLTYEEIMGFFETALKAGFYTYIRYLMNINHGTEAQKAAIWLFVNEYAYGNMSRYNKDGLFNVPYGGKSYNTKLLGAKVEKYGLLPDVTAKFSNTHLYNLDFIEFLESFEEVSPLNDNDFIFLDPPYDSAFSDYDGIEFGESDHKRLAEYLAGCKANFMLVIKYTPFILSLYENKGFNVLAYDTRYTWDIKGRNEGNKKVNHLMITNYYIAPELKE